ncbi:hypothetical protein BTA51_12520 [Hahella sp. CCB-MM4]|uniref:MmcQ/YjbR family DNA-binding protein n=1 Tax=Hahella sp. (strain CCB-MM4) TaxID=1926491 RepID=UPI000B9C103E|nr:MmcQ/YjbR family DNA-binding protein [Hahella sp. CCB-MM4]OZG73293.1 hypothetical protein BTA51_12520 [Hahella sp. CCB-MM4]
MDFNSARQYLLNKPSAIEDFPFGPDVLVFKVEDKMFATLSQSGETAQMNLKCHPEQALALRDIFPAVIPGYHMNKKHWNTIILDGTIPIGEIERMIDHSYSLVVRSLTKAKRNALELRYGATVLYRE